MYDLFCVAISNTDNATSDVIMTKNDNLIAIQSMNESIPVGTEKLSLHCHENHENPQENRYFGPYSNQGPPECFTS